MNSQRFIKVVLRLLVPTALLVASCSAEAPDAESTTAAAPRSQDETPVIIYLIDTLRADRLGLYGYDKSTSPRIDALAQESVVFDRAYSAASWTMPSVASLFTSRYPCEHGLQRTGFALSPQLPTLAEHFQQLGYATAAFYQNAFIDSQYTGIGRAFQTEEFRQEMETLDQDARGFLKKVTGQPFFLYLHSMEPHASYYAPRDLLRQFGHVSIDDTEAYRAHWEAYKQMWFADARAGKPVGGTDTTAGIDKARENLAAMRTSVERLYDASVRFADLELGQAIDEMKAAGIWDRALFILLADHGEELSDHGLWFHDQSVYEELTHVPMLVHFPQGEFAGQRIRERVSLLDVMPTILDYLGHADLCKGCRGSSLLPLVNPAAGGTYTSAAVPSMRNNAWGYYKPLKQEKGDINIVVRDGAIKGIWNKEPGRVELYDLSADPREKQDLGAGRPEKAQAVAREAAEWLAVCDAQLVPPVFVPPDTIDEARRERLRAHGYFGQ
jgi:arylsulfatase A-like enzyme